MGHVVLFRGEHIDVVPRDARQDGHVRAVPQELGSAVDGGAQVLVSFNHGPFVAIVQVHHPVEPFQLGPHHEVGLHSCTVQGMEDHGRDGGFAMTSGHDHSLLLFRGEAQEFRVALDGQFKFLCAQELGIFLAGVHAKNDHVQIGGDVGRMPAFLRGEQSGLFQPSTAGLEDLVVAPCHVVPRVGHGQREVVHGASAHRNQMNSHEGKFTSFGSQSWQASTHFLTFAT